jgi:uncharacterized protein YidB (DUF937 family)
MIRLSRSRIEHSSPDSNLHAKRTEFTTATGLVNGASAPSWRATATGNQGGIGGMLGQLTGSLGGASAGGFLSGGLGELVDRFKQSGQGATAESWVGLGPNQQIAPPQLEQAIGPDVLNTLSKQTGLSRADLLARFSRELPDAVDKYTPQGRLPTEA